MKLVTNLFQGKPPSLEEGPTRYRSSNEYLVLHRDEGKTNCSKFIGIVKVIFWIELIILVGWLGCVSLSNYNRDRAHNEAKPWTKIGCGTSAIGCRISGINNEMSDESIEVENRRGSRSVGDVEIAASNLTEDCYDAETQLLEERRARLEAIANEDTTDDLPSMRTKTFLDAIEAALNATSPSEVTVADDLLQNDSGLIPWKRFVSNASLELAKEFYKLVRDEFLELRSEKKASSGWQGYDLARVYHNWTDGLSSLTENATPEAVLNITIKFGKSFNLHYLEAIRENSLVDSNTPVFGTFTYLDEEPENLGVRHMRNILNGFARLYFRVLNRLGPCHPIEEPLSEKIASETPTRGRRFTKKRSVTADPTPEPITVTCWSGEQEPALLEERRARLEAFVNDNATGKVELHEQNFFNALETVLNATGTSEIQFDDKYTRPRMILSTMVYLTSNASLELHKEGYEIIRDLFLELRHLNNHSSEWKGYDVDSISANLSTNLGFQIKMTAQSIFNDFLRIGEPFNLRYTELENRDSGDEPDKPVHGRFTYLGETPETPGIRRIRHVLDGFVKFYFKTQDPSTPGMCNSSARPQAEAGESETTTRDKRSVMADPIPERKHPNSSTATSWSKEQETVLLEERRERLEAFANRNKTAMNNANNSYTQDYLKGIEAALKATSTSEIHFDENLFRSTPMLSIIKYLATNSSLELHKEGFEFARDLYLEMDELKNHSPEWDGYNEDSIKANITDTHIFSGANMTSESMFNNFVRFGQTFNLRYEELENRDSRDEPKKPVFGKFTYLGEEPEKLGIRHLRHILDSFVRFYFKTQNPSAPAVCNSSAEPRAEGGEDEIRTRNTAT